MKFPETEIKRMILKREYVNYFTLRDNVLHIMQELGHVTKNASYKFWCSFNDLSNCDGIFHKPYDQLYYDLFHQYAETNNIDGVKTPIFTHRDVNGMTLTVWRIDIDNCILLLYECGGSVKYKSTIIGVKHIPSVYLDRFPEYNR